MDRRTLLALLSGAVGMSLADGAFAGPGRRPGGIVGRGGRGAGSTVLGVFNPGSQPPASVAALGARAVRFIFPIDSLACDASGVACQGVTDQLKAYKCLGFMVIATVAHWNGPTKKTPLPGAAQQATMLAHFTNFLNAAGPFIDICSIDNEPLFDVAPSDFKPGSNGTAPIIAWYQTLARRAKEVARGIAPGMRVAAPALSDIQRVSTPHKKVDPGVQAQLDTLIKWEIHDPNIDLVDVHLHVSDVPEIVSSLQYLNDPKSMTGPPKPVIVTEWSQAGLARKWVKQPIDPAFAKAWQVNPGQTNDKYISNAYARPVSSLEWNAFVGTVGYVDRFMADAFRAMSQAGVVAATYGAVLQYKDPAFDTKQLLANLTVPPGPQGPVENASFATWYRALAKSLPAPPLTVPGLCRNLPPPHCQPGMRCPRPS